MTEIHRPWTNPEIHKAARIWQRDYADHYGEEEVHGAQRATFLAIAKALDRTADSVLSRYRLHGPSFAANNRGGPSAAAESERKKRLEAASQRSPIAAFLNDPPPGYSALDRKRSGHGPRL
jgi:hypothetical protein